MKLTENHIEQLYIFTREHYVEYYDVQTEIVDHLANDIEQIWVSQPLLSFEQAREKSFKKFGIFGFMDVVNSKESQMTKKYFKLILKFTKEWFQLPKIVLTIVLSFLFYQLQNIPNADMIYNAIFMLVVFGQITLMILNSRKLKKKFKVTQKKWLFENVINIQGLGASAILFIYFFDFPFSNTNAFLAMGDFRKVYSAFLITFLVIIGYITLVVIPKKANQLLEETYPKHKLS
jgi:heme exporter protein D